ncbi:MAG TPA: iron ABC transporter permease, partial [Phycisphaerales bacterium]|nr:iron ABC transporter permease [Phycisphaerales bacterium]
MHVSRNTRASLLAISLIAMLTIVMLYPIWLTVQGGFESVRADHDGGASLTLYHVKMVFVDPMLRTGLLHSLGLACSTTLISFLIALPLAMLSARFNFPGKSALGICVLVPMILPAFVGAIGLQHLLGTSGAINALLMKLGLVHSGIDFIGRGGFWAVTVVQALYLFPIFYLN